MSFWLHRLSDPTLLSWDMKSTSESSFLNTLSLGWPWLANKTILIAIQYNLMQVHVINLIKKGHEININDIATSYLLFYQIYITCTSIGHFILANLTHKALGAWQKLFQLIFEIPICNIDWLAKIEWYTLGHIYQIPLKNQNFKVGFLFI